MLVAVILQTLTLVSAFAMLLVKSHLRSDGCREREARAKTSGLAKNGDTLHNQNI